MPKHIESGEIINDFREAFKSHPNILERFVANVSKQGVNECWPWTGPINAWGYGDFNWSYRHHKAHRVAWSLKNGPIQNGLFILHKCDNRPCCNPIHLFVGTQMDNMRDCAQKGRFFATLHPEEMSRGVAHGMSKLDDAKVAAIRQLNKIGHSSYSLAKPYGVNKSTILRIVRREAWRHVL